MAENLLANIPLYDPVISGWPAYMWIIAGLCFVIFIGALAVYSEVYIPLKPVWGFRKASKSPDPKKTLALIRTMDRKMWMQYLDYITNVFEALDLHLKWFITVKAGYQMGHVNVIDVSDDWGVVSDLDLDYAIAASANAWNREHDEKDQLHDWPSYSEKLMDGSLDKFFPEGFKMPPFRIVQMDEIRKYRPKWQAGHTAGYLNAKKEERIGDVDDKQKQFLYYVIAGILGLVIVTAICYMWLTNVKCPVCG